MVRLHRKPRRVDAEKEVIIMTFGEKLKEARKEAGLSQEQFAEKLSVSRSAVAKWESDKGIPDVNNLKLMAQLLVNISTDFIRSRGLANKVDPKKFDFGNYTFRKVTYQLI